MSDAKILEAESKGRTIAAKVLTKIDSDLEIKFTKEDDQTDVNTAFDIYTLSAGTITLCIEVKYRNYTYDTFNDWWFDEYKIKRLQDLPEKTKKGNPTAKMVMCVHEDGYRIWDINAPHSTKWGWFPKCEVHPEWGKVWKPVCKYDNKYAKWYDRLNDK